MPFPKTCLFPLTFIYLPLTHSARSGKEISHDKSAELARLYSKVQWLEQWNTNLIARLGEANTLVSDLGAQYRAQKEELARAIEEHDA